MARILESRCSLCRRDGERLYLKGARCHTAKCAVSKRAYPPGMHGFRRGRASGYGTRLRESQKAKRYYGVHNRQFRNYYTEAARRTGNTGEHLLVLLERRLDNVVNLLGFGDGRVQSRQIIQHGHITVNGKKVDIPSYQVRAGHVIGVSGRKASQKFVRERLEGRKGESAPAWLNVDPTRLEGNVVRLPSREDVALPVIDSHIVEFCSR